MGRGRLDREDLALSKVLIQERHQINRDNAHRHDTYVIIDEIHPADCRPCFVWQVSVKAAPSCWVGSTGTYVCLNCQL
jgi:hypothetical protein